MTKKKKNLIIWVVIALVLLVGAYFLFIRKAPENLVEVGGLYNANGDLIQQGLSVIGGVEGIKYITLKISVKNLDSIPLTLTVKSLTPTEIINAKPTDKITVNSGEIGTWITGLIDIEPYERMTQDFCVTVISEKVPALREPFETTGCVSVKVDPNPVANFDISLDSQIGDGNVNPGCTEVWTCGSWVSCINGVRTRTCTDSNNCGTTANKPEEQQICESTFQTNAVNGNYRVSGVYIIVGGITYYYSGYSTYSCLTENVIIETPEKYKVCSRPGYDITSRVYLDDGRGNIFKP